MHDGSCHRRGSSGPKNHCHFHTNFWAYKITHETKIDHYVPMISIKRQTLWQHEIMTAWQKILLSLQKCVIMSQWSTISMSHRSPMIGQYNMIAWLTVTFEPTLRDKIAGELKRPLLFYTRVISKRGELDMNNSLDRQCLSSVSLYLTLHFLLYVLQPRDKAKTIDRQCTSGLSLLFY